MNDGITTKLEIGIWLRSFQTKWMNNRIPTSWKRIEKETKDRKLELERLREAARELEETNHLTKAEEKLKQINRRSNKIQARLSEKKNFRHELLEDRRGRCSKEIS